MLRRPIACSPSQLVLCFALLLSLVCLCPARAAGAAKATRPNIVLILADDLGYSDVGCFGAKGFETPNLDRLAREGMRFSDFYVGSSVCSPSRAALLTGCYPQRVGLPVVLEADSPIGLSATEETLPELLKRAGYATGIFGKWHLGDRPSFLPTRHGFDEYFGLPYSNDMWPWHPTKRFFFPDLPLMEGEKVIGHNPDQRQLTTWYTERATDFIGRHKAEPFFLYLPQTMPHVPLAVSDKYRGKSAAGPYGDACMEVDWSVGQVLEALERHGLTEKTIVIFLSDNGPWLTYGDHGGTARPLRDGKTTSFEGGFRVPLIVRYPGQVPANRLCREMALSMDLLPTLVKLAGAPSPKAKIDGRDIAPLLRGDPEATTPHDAFFYYNAWSLEAVRSGTWKLLLPQTRFAVSEPGTGGMPGKQTWTQAPMALYDLLNDPGESSDVALEHPEVVTRLLTLMAAARNDLGDGVMRIDQTKVDFFQARKLYRLPGQNLRDAGRDP